MAEPCFIYFFSLEAGIDLILYGTYFITVISKMYRKLVQYSLH